MQMIFLGAFFVILTMVILWGSIMTLTEFVALVEKMRISQRRYFKTRDNNVLENARALEKRVDDVIYGIRNPDLFKTRINKMEWKIIHPDQDIQFVYGDWHLTIHKNGYVYFTNYKLMCGPAGYAEEKFMAIRQFIDRCDEFAETLAKCRSEAEKFLEEQEQFPKVDEK